MNLAGFIVRSCTTGTAAELLVQQILIELLLLRLSPGDGRPRGCDWLALLFSWFVLCWWLFRQLFRHLLRAVKHCHNSNNSTQDRSIVGDNLVVCSKQSTSADGRAAAGCNEFARQQSAAAAAAGRLL